MNDSKPLVKSKVFWANLLIPFIAIVVPEINKNPELLIALQGILNIILRLVTTNGISGVAR